MHTLIPRRALFLMPWLTQAAPPPPEIWNFDRLDRIGGHATTLLGKPKLIDTPGGKAVEFDGVQDAIFLDVHPLAGAAAFTWEVIFRPATGGRPEQRFFHLQESGSNYRLLLETRLMGDQWCLDSFAASSTGQQPLMDRKLLHPLDQWHHVAFVYDGSQMRHYVNHKLELSASVKLAPQAEGKTSVGVRINRVDFFKGAIRSARFHREAIEVERFLPLP